MIHKFELPPSIQIAFDADGVEVVVDAIRIDSLYHDVYSKLPPDPTDTESEESKKRRLVREVEDWLEPFTDRFNLLYQVSLSPVQAYAVLAECWSQITALKKSSAPALTQPTTLGSEFSELAPSPTTSSSSSTTNSEDSEPKTSLPSVEQTPV